MPRFGAFHKCAPSLITCALAALVGRAAPVAAQPIDDPAARVSLVTVGPGPGFFSWFGHTALIVTWPDGTSWLYQYLSPLTPHALMTGDFAVDLSSRPADSVLTRWHRDHRPVRVQDLALTATQFQALLRRLDAGLHQVTQVQGYDPRTANCTTLIRDMLDSVTDGALRRAGTAPASASQRTLGYRAVTATWVIAMSDVLFNDSYDGTVSRWEAAFVPDELAHLVADAEVADDQGESRPLVAARTTPSFTPRPVGTLLAKFPAAALIEGFVAGIAFLLLGRATSAGHATARIGLGLAAAGIGGVLGLLGTTLAVGSAFTSYQFLRHNENLLLLNPLLLLAVPLGVRYATGSVRAGRWLRQLALFAMTTGALALALKAVSGFHQDNWRTLMLVVPCLTGLAAALHAAREQSVPSRAQPNINAPNAITTRISGVLGS